MASISQISPVIVLFGLVASASLAAQAAGASTAGVSTVGRAGRGEVTFSEHVAPIVFNNCTSCHRAGEIGPFALSNFQQVRRKGRMIKRVTQKRFMPPWHPVPGHGDFEDSRRMSDADIKTIADWVDGGMPEGDSSKLPPMPKFVEGWQLGKPDLVLSMAEGYTVKADGPDIYRNFVLPLDLPEDKWVVAVEVRPGARTVLHHTLFLLDGTRASRDADGSDGEPGFRGMSRLSGSLGGWAVGGTARKLPDGMAMHLPAGSDLVLSSHLHPSGKTEIEKTSVGLFFADKPPTKRLLKFQVPAMYGALAGLRIKAGDKNHRLEERFTLPCDVELVTIGGHAHYLCKSMQATALLPDGTTKKLFYIDNWAFNWQGRYQYKKPVRLPSGTIIHSVLIYDNSADNPQNPHDPPRDVKWGLQSTDEMGSVIFLGTPVHHSDYARFKRATRMQLADSFLSRLGGRGNRDAGLKKLMGEISQYDLDKDGDVVITDIKSRWRRRMASQLDRNSDGTVTKGEVEAVRMELESRRTRGGFRFR